MHGSEPASGRPGEAVARVRAVDAGQDHPPRRRRLRRHPRGPTRTQAVAPRAHHESGAGRVAPCPVRRGIESGTASRVTRPSSAGWTMMPPGRRGALPHRVGGMHGREDRRGSPRRRPEPRRSCDSVAVWTRRRIDDVMFARRSGVMAPRARRVARTRCTPSDRPSAAIFMRSATAVGTSSLSMRNSSITTTSRGGHVAGDVRRSASVSGTPWSAHSASRRRSSARKDASARAVDSEDRSVMLPTQCGRAASAPSPEPPL